MSITTQSPGYGTAIRSHQTEQMLHAAGRPAGPHVSVTSDPMDKARLMVLNRFGGHRDAGAGISQEDLHELSVFDEFLAYHVQPNGICDVQCMLLWSEWVRAFRRQTHKFPKLILENEFHSVIADTFGVEVINGGFRGSIYNGIRFVP